jgi:predicted DCC family thiol-disulfide oxidoreductase YuxK
MADETKPALTVWYNTKCPVCDAGIGWQQRRLVSAARSGVIQFRDINLEPAALDRFGAGLEDIRRRLHGVDGDGRLQVGIDCAIAIWRLTPGTQWLGWVMTVPGVHGVTAFAYDRFADVLYAWNRRKGHW